MAIDGVYFDSKQGVDVWSVNRPKKTVVMTSFGSAKEAFRCITGGNYTFYCIDLEKLKVEIVLTRDQAQAFYNSTGETEC